MRPISVVVVMVLMLGVGVYIGVSGLATQLAVDLDLSRGSAADAACAPDHGTAAIGESVYFAVAGLDPAVPYSWSTDQGRASRLNDGRLWVVYAEAGIKSVSAFVPGVADQWQRMTCSVQIQ